MIFIVVGDHENLKEGKFPTLGKNHFLPAGGTDAPIWVLIIIIIWSDHSPKGT